MLKKEIELVNESAKDRKDPFRDFYNFPHSAEFKEERWTTNVRVVFDGAAENGDGILLNSQLLVGPALQQGKASLQILLRLQKYVTIGDISRMFFSMYLQL